MQRNVLKWLGTVRGEQFTVERIKTPPRGRESTQEGDWNETAKGMPVLRRVSGAGTPRRLLQNRMQESALSVKADGEHQGQRYNRRVEYTAETEEEGGGRMTREEHIENLKAMASDMPSDKCADWIESLMAGVKALEQEPCEDAVSRSAVLDLPRIKTHNVWGNVIYESVDVENVRQLPSVTPQPKWILCKDRMPDYHQLVLTFDGEYICVEQRIPYIIDENGNKHIGSEWWVDVNYVTDSELYSGLRDGAAVAWMPLPTPPNKSEIPTGQIVANGELYPGEFYDPLVAEGSDKV